MLRLLADESFNGRAVRGLLLRNPSLDLVRVQDVGMSGRSDLEILAWAAENDRIVLTHDLATMPAYAFSLVTAGDRMRGLFALSSRCPVRIAIQEILLMDECSEQAEWNGRVVYLPV
jgi:hypothetical protein